MPHDDKEEGTLHEVVAVTVDLTEHTVHVLSSRSDIDIESNHKLEDARKEGDTAKIDEEGSINRTEYDDSHHELPPALYDPMTGALMVDPVVLTTTGNSYERAVAESFADSSCFYTNWALQALLLEYAQTTLYGDATESMRATMCDAGRNDIHSAGYNSQLSSIKLSLRSFLAADLLLPIGVISGNPKRLHESLYCPITCDFMDDPVITPDGNTYERSAIEDWVRIHRTSPVTRKFMTCAQLCPTTLWRRSLGGP